MDNEQQSVSSDTELESGTQSNVSDVVQEVQCENLGAEGQEMLPLPPSDSVDSGNTVPSASTGHGPESGEVSEVQSLRVMFERMLNFQAEFVRVQAERDRERDAKQAERDRERDAKQAERDRERDAEQAERDQRLVAEFACMQAERDRERDAEQAERDQRLVAEFAKQAERDRERDAKQAERDRRLHERDLQLMQTLEVMQSEIVSLKQKYETIPKTVQELSERVDSVQVANANIVEEISVLTNRVEQLEIDTTQVIENKVIEQVHKVENEVIKEIDQKVHAIVEEISVLTNRVEQLEIDTTQVIENKVIEQVHKVENEVIKEIDQKVHAAIEARDVGSSADVQDLKRIVHKDIPLWQRSVDRRLAEMELSLRHDEARAYVTPARSKNDRHINTAVKNCDCETEQATNLAHVSSPARDLAYLLYANTDLDVHERLPSLLETYHSQLQASLRALGMPASAAAYPLDELLRDMEDLKHFALYASSCSGFTLSSGRVGDKFSRALWDSIFQADTFYGIYDNECSRPYMEYIIRHFESKGLL
ncbi:uncharacterized protein LOC124775384 [Schistocerca piceifrons]|uniref:uncharacterized protein LOC124775384 n=1 Tax=Schistocerca piceifrons TaxID=274613 RepID=UPI001F5EEC48|nr:uncharacterized protein LOC124775384 [Schistocerca piceifrons]